VVAWTELPRAELDEVWSRYYKAFVLRGEPRLYKDRAQGPAAIYSFDESLDEAAHRRAYRDFALRCICELTPPGKTLYALDWQHTSFRVDPHLAQREDKLPIGLYPDGDCYVFIPEDFAFGYHARFPDWTIAIHGEPLVRMFEQCPPYLANLEVIEVGLEAAKLVAATDAEIASILSGYAQECATVQAGIVRSLAAAGRIEALALAQALLASPDVQIRKHAALALVQAGDSRGASILRGLATSNITTQLLADLEQIKTPNATKLFLKLSSRAES